MSVFIISTIIQLSLVALNIRAIFTSFSLYPNCIYVLSVGDAVICQTISPAIVIILHDKFQLGFIGKESDLERQLLHSLHGR